MSERRALQDQRRARGQSRDADPAAVRIDQKLSKQELAEKFEEVGVPAGPINTLADVFDDPQVQARGMRMDLPHPTPRVACCPGVRAPITHQRPQGRGRPPAEEVGEHRSLAQRSAEPTASPAFLQTAKQFGRQA